MRRVRFAALTFALVALASGCGGRAGNRAPEVALTDQTGAPFSLAAQRGKAVVLFFGYAHCTDICPATLAQLAHGIATLPPAERGRVEVAFVTVDPARDTPAALAAYLARFDRSFVGLTGTYDELVPVYKAYRVFRQRLAPHRRGDPNYPVAHEGLLYVIGADGTVRARRSWQDPPATVAADIRAAV